MREWQRTTLPPPRPACTATEATCRAGADGRAPTLRHLRDDGCTRAHLWTLRDTPQSRRFYIKCGFAETGADRPYDFGDGNPLTQVEYERGC
ncbi:GNAT family N-acetyltransferase [Streptomyces sp. NPDC058892]|uniref:GNAT family N-acetyltransferase n=1 Tax=unclassified Streptomyces TaxID=2593676 RepID=UPI0036981F13